MAASKELIKYQKLKSLVSRDLATLWERAEFFDLQAKYRKNASPAFRAAGKNNFRVGRFKRFRDQIRQLCFEQRNISTETKKRLLHSYENLFIDLDAAIKEQNSYDKFKAINKTNQKGT